MNRSVSDRSRGNDAGPGIKADGKRGGLEARLMIIGIGVMAVVTAVALVMIR